MNVLATQIALLGALVLVTPADSKEEPVALPDTPVGRQTQLLLDALASADRDKIQKFIKENLAESFLSGIPLEKHVELNYRFGARAGRLTPISIVSASDKSLRFLARSKKDQVIYQVAVELEASKPNKIARLGFTRPQPSSKVAAPPLPQTSLDDPRMKAWLEDYLERLTKADGFSGAVLLAHGDQILFAKPFGLASRAWNVPNRLDTKFNLGSMNKMFTSIAVAQLVEQGKIALDDPIGKYLPDYPNRDAAERVKIRHLLTHTSGLADYFNDKFTNASRTRFRSIADYFPLFAAEPLEFDPGARFRYSNAGFMVLGAIVEKASGSNYFDYVRNHIYKPAGMVNTDAYELDQDIPNLAVGYTQDSASGGSKWRNNIFLHVIKGGPAGGGYSTVEDLHHFAQALRSGKLIRPETLKQWSTPSDKNPGYAFGLIVYNANRPKVIGHSGGFPGISSVLCFDVDSGYTLAVLSNMDGGSTPIMEKMKEVIAREQK